MQAESGKTVFKKSGPLNKSGFRSRMQAAFIRDMSFTGIDSDYNLNAGSGEETGKKTGKKVARRATPDYIRNDKIIMRRTTLQVWIHGSETLRNVQERSSETPFSNVQKRFINVSAVVVQNALLLW